MDGLRVAHGLRKSKVCFQGFLTLVAAMTVDNISAVTSFIHTTSQLYRYHVIFLHISSSSYIRGREGPAGAQRHPKRPFLNTWYVSNEFLVFNLGNSPAHLPGNASLDWTVPAVKASGKWKTLSENMGFDDYMELSYLHCPKHSGLLSSDSHTCKFTFSFTFILALTLTSFNSFKPSIQWNS